MFTQDFIFEFNFDLFTKFADGSFERGLPCFHRSTRNSPLASPAFDIVTALGQKERFDAAIIEVAYQHTRCTV